jgi:hypothetical protein
MDSQSPFAMTAGITVLQLLINGVNKSRLSELSGSPGILFILKLKFTLLLNLSNELTLGVFYAYPN